MMTLYTDFFQYSSILSCSSLDNLNSFQVKLSTYESSFVEIGKLITPKENNRIINKKQIELITNLMKSLIV